MGGGSVPSERPAAAEDIAVGGSLSLVAPFRIVNIGSSNKVGLLDLIEALEDMLGKKAIRNYVEMQPWDVPATWAKTESLDSLTGYVPQTELKDGVENSKNGTETIIKKLAEGDGSQIIVAGGFASNEPLEMPLR